MVNYLNVATAILASLGTSGVIIWGLSNYLGSIWANRLFAKERNKYDREIESLRNELRRDSEEYLSKLTSEIEIYKQTHLREHSDKLMIYRATIDLVATMLAKIEMVYLKNKEKLSPEEQELFEAERLRIYGYLAMLAPQNIMDANDKLMDLLLALIYDDKPTSWEDIRYHALLLTNAMRNDIGLNKISVEYNGSR
ncbi:hypothetical protein OAG1_00610 [Agarivorans sp. OAG1]|uniref:hypothetical protein n=1 Tax=Agarivorans sp. OAG1 TaxID=3082387 RepID=UPI002B2AF58B|nr:hypothetical protein OAG1_00610 [Agarivorans sp. OAG1]